jgi:hypothetical protein
MCKPSCSYTTEDSKQSSEITSFENFLPESCKKVKYFCILCEGFCLKENVEIFINENDYLNHLKYLHLKICSKTEKYFFDEWFQCNKLYLIMLNSTMNREIKTIPGELKILYRDCPVCLSIINVYKIDEENIKKSHNLTIKNFDIKINSDEKRKHIMSHIRYFPYRCGIHEKDDIDVYFTDPNVLKIHIEKTHESYKDSYKNWMIYHPIEFLEIYIDNFVSPFNHLPV